MKPDVGEPSSLLNGIELLKTNSCIIFLYSLICISLLEWANLILFFLKLKFPGLFFKRLFFRSNRTGQLIENKFMCFIFSSNRGFMFYLKIFQS